VLCQQLAVLIGRIAPDTRGTDVTIGYLDPGSGSLIASAVVGGVAAAGVAVRQARHRLTSRFSRKQGEAEATSQKTESGVDDPATTEA
jgi:ethanolamine utilization microcompartment shell protein EutS